MKPELLAAMLADKATQAAVDRFVSRRQRQRELQRRELSGVPDPGAMALGLLDMAEQIENWSESELTKLADSYRHADTMPSLVMAGVLSKVRRVVQRDRVMLESAVARAKVRDRLRQSGPKPDRLLILLVTDLAGIVQKHTNGLKALQGFALAVNHRLPRHYRADEATLMHTVKTLRTAQ